MPTLRLVISRWIRLTSLFSATASTEIRPSWASVAVSCTWAATLTASITSLTAVTFASSSCFTAPICMAKVAASVAVRCATSRIAWPRRCVSAICAPAVVLPNASLP